MRASVAEREEHGHKGGADHPVEHGEHGRLPVRIAQDHGQGGVLAGRLLVMLLSVALAVYRPIQTIQKMSIIDTISAQ